MRMLINDAVLRGRSFDNNGLDKPDTYSQMRSRCGGYKRIVMAGYRAGSNHLTRFDMTLRHTFVHYLPASFPSSHKMWENFDTAGK